MYSIFVRRILGVLAVLVLLLVAGYASLAQAQSPNADPARAEIARLEDRWLKAIEDADEPALDAILADDFVRPAPASGQFITKSQVLAYYRSHKTSADSGSRRIENLVVHVYGDMAIARGTVVASDPKGRIVSRNLFTDVFVIRGGRWQAVSAQENDVKADPAVETY